jgi:uncharacterized Tic20 family protein
MSNPSEPTGPARPGTGVALTAEQDRLWASLAHLGGIFAFPPALVIWLVFRDRGRFTNQQGREALNFQLTLLIGYVVINVLSTILALFTFGILGGLSSLGWVLWLIGSIFSVLGYLDARAGKPYRYPFAIRLIS